MKDIFIPNDEILRQKEIAASLVPYFTGKKAFVRSFGCQQNEADGERILGALELCGLTRTDSALDADVIIINTCAIREHAEQKVFSHIGELKKLKEQKSGLLIGVCGCMPQQEHRMDKLKQSFPYVDFVFGTDMHHRVPEIIASALRGGKRGFFVSALPHTDFGVISEGMPIARSSKIKAYVSCMYGCNNFCSYCVVPFVRGRERSRSSAEVLAEVESLLSDGCRDITLLGQNVNSYSGELSFPKLLEAAASFGGEYRVRFMTSHPKDASDELIDVIANNKNVAKHFHLPFQSGSDRILSLMNRRYTREKYLERARAIRERIDGVALSSDIIVGFPSETEEDFEQTLSVVREVGFDMIYSFIFSPRKGTRAAEMEGAIPHGVQVERFSRLSALQDEIALARNTEAIGKTVRVLSEGENTGRTEGNKIITFDGDAAPGEFIDVEITSAQPYALHGKIK